MNNLTEALAMDCEMVGAGPKGRISMAARVSLVNEYGKCVLDTFIKPDRKVTDYRTFVSGITPGHLSQGRPFDVVKREVARHIKGRILIGHSVEKDLRVLGLSHPEWNIRDTADYPPFQTKKGRRPALKYLAERYLGWSIQTGSHSSVQDAKAAMKLYKTVEDDWEEWLRESDSEEEVVQEYYDYEEENPWYDDDGDYYYDY